MMVSTPFAAKTSSAVDCAGVDSACARPDMRDLKAMSEFSACKSAAISSAAQQLNSAGTLFGASRIVALN